MADDATPLADDTRLHRRQLLKRAGVAAGVAWTAPAIMTINVAAAAAGSPPPHPECEGATCDTFLPCSSQNIDCICASTADGAGICIPGSTECASLEPCDGNRRCAPGSVCVVNSCCGVPVCVPVALANQCPPPPSLAPRVRRSLRSGTLGG